MSDIGSDVFADMGVVSEYVVLWSVFSSLDCGWFCSVECTSICILRVLFYIEPPLHIKNIRRVPCDMKGWLHIKKHSTNADTNTLYITNHPQLTNEKKDNRTTYSGTTPYSAKCQHQYWTQIPCPSGQALPKRLQT